MKRLLIASVLAVVSAVSLWVSPAGAVDWCGDSGISSAHEMGTKLIVICNDGTRFDLVY